MATTTDVQPQVRMIALEQIRHDANVRELASEDVDALAGSIALLGQITPAIVRADGDGYLLIAGHSATPPSRSSDTPRFARKSAPATASTPIARQRTSSAPN